MKKHVFYFNLLKMQAMKGMKIWLVTLVMAFVLEAQGQGWMKTYEQPGYQIAYGVAPTAEGGVLALASGGTSLLKVDGSGNLLFEKNLDEGIPNVIISVPDGNFAVAGIIYQNIMDNNAGNDSIYVFLTKVNPNGDIIWHNKLLISTFAQDAAINALATDSNGGFKLAGFYGSGDPMGSIFFKADDSGNIEILNTQVPGGDSSAKDMVSNPNGDFVVAGQVDSSLFGSNYRGPYLIKASNAGVKIWGETYENNTVFNSLVNAANGGYMVAGDANQNASDKNPLCLKVDDNGNEIWQKKWIDIKATINEIIIAQGGGYYLFGNTFKGPYDNIPDNLLLIKIDENGNELWRKIFGSLSWEEGRQLFQTQAGNLFIGGGAYSSSSSYDVLLAKLDSLGNIYASAITGSVHFDPESDCQFDPTEPGLAGWLVQAIGIQSSATLTDNSGNYFLAVDTGNYELQIIPPVGPYWEVCNSPYQVDIPAFYDTISIDFPVRALADCPYLTVDISAPFLRRCFDNNYYVHYCNDGTASANDATVEVTLDPYFTYVSSTLPLASQNGNTLSFDLGDVAVGDCGNFQITAYLDCDSTVLGQTHCTTAHITPDSLCLPPDPLWDGSSIETDASCDGDSIHFTITNVGAEDMPSPLGYIIIEDEIVLLTNDFQLGAGQSIIVTLPANGGTFHLEAQQAAAHPSGFASTGATIEGCGSWLSLGFFTQWSFDDDPDPFTDVDCQANVGSFDPNDKQGFPTGLGAAPTEIGVIEPGQDIEYLIRFQNTGTDTAFKVTVVDVLPPELDLATVRPGASSHPYTYGVTPEGWLTFTFDDIQLPDSTTNGAASHGFVRFRASQRPGLGWGNVIANTALIYFDFNAPVQTNTFKHRIGQVFPWTLVGTTPPVFQPKANVKIVPNPLTDSALLQVEGIESGPLNLVLTDVSGKILRQQTVNGTGFEFQRGELNPGLYFFKIERNGERVGSGKLMVK